MRDKEGQFIDGVAAYGITPRFLKDFVGRPDKDITLAYMKSINYQKASTIWQASRWLWYKCEMIASDEIGILIFDWAVRRPAIVAQEMAAIVGLKLSDCEHPYMVELGGNPAKKTDAFYYPSVTIIDKINDACKVNGQYNQAKIQELYDKLILRRIATESGQDNEGVKRRLGCLLFGEWTINVDSFNGLPATRKKQILDTMTKLKPRKGLIVRKQPNLNDDTEGGMSFTKMAAWGVGIFFGGKWFKLW